MYFTMPCFTNIVSDSDTRDGRVPSNINAENRQARTGVMLTKNWTFQQDWAPAHRAKTTVELNREQFPDLRQRHLTIKLA
uniref:Homeobox domain-containing protein n=1 Tax=Heterorhabditis bacteriophora TaxID=37862 RepID=A0A1I7XSW0_HETBA